MIFQYFLVKMHIIYFQSIGSIAHIDLLATFKCGVSPHGGADFEGHGTDTVDLQIKLPEFAIFRFIS